MKRNVHKTAKPEGRRRTAATRGKRANAQCSHEWSRFYAALGAILAALCLAWLCGRASASMTDCLEATCRITAPDGSRGTGCVFEINHGQVYILTVAHVVGQHPGVQCEFWRNGHQSQPLAGRVLSRTRESQGDAAIVAVEVTRFGGVLPAVVPVAAPDYALRDGEAITSAGCPNGAWSTGWKGHVVRLSDGDLHFVPPPAQGRSGSAIFDAEGRQIVGLLRARTIDNQEGIACSVQSLYRQLGYPTAERQTQCGPGGCTGGAAPDYRLLPFRQKQEFEQWRSNNSGGSNAGGSNAGPWPTLPAGERVDLSDTNRRLDRIAELLLQVRTPEPAQRPAPVDPRSEAAEKTAKEAQNSVAEMKQEQSKLREHLGDVRSVLEKLVGDPGTLSDRIHARLEKVKGEGAEGTREVIRAYVRDFLGEKLEDNSLGLGLGKTLGGMLGLSAPLAVALGAGLWLIARQIGQKVSAGEPLLVQQLFSRLTDKIDDLKSRVHSDKTGG